MHPWAHLRPPCLALLAAGPQDSLLPQTFISSWQFKQSPLHSELFSPPRLSSRQPEGLSSNLNIVVIMCKCRKRRSAAEYGNMTSVEKQEALLQSYMDTVGQMPDLSVQKDMVAKYLECGSEPSVKKDSPSLHGCLQKLSCVLYDKSVKISDGEKEIANM